MSHILVTIVCVCVWQSPSEPETIQLRWCDVIDKGSGRSVSTDGPMLQSALQEHHWDLTFDGARRIGAPWIMTLKRIVARV